jgi:hypothetical protein
MRRASSIIQKFQQVKLDSRQFRSFHVVNFPTSREEYQESVLSYQQRNFWLFSNRQKKYMDDQVSVHMPKKYVKEDDKNHARYKTEIQDILNSPIGTISSSMWIKAERIIEHVAEKVSIPQAFRLLDRLALEHDANIKLNHDSIYFVVQRWLNASQQQKTPVYPALKVWRRIEDYQKAGITLESRTYHRIIEGLAIGRYKKPNNHHGPGGPQLAEIILKRMMELSKHENPVVRPSTYTFNAVLVAWENAASSSSWAKVEAPVVSKSGEE